MKPLAPNAHDDLPAPPSTLDEYLAGLAPLGDESALLIAALCERLRSQTNPLNHASPGAMADALEACGLALVKAASPRGNNNGKS
jgi:hypothetical protein